MQNIHEYVSLGLIAVATAYAYQKAMVPTGALYAMIGAVIGYALTKTLSDISEVSALFSLKGMPEMQALTALTLVDLVAMAALLLYMVVSAERARDLILLGERDALAWTIRRRVTAPIGVIIALSLLALILGNDIITRP
jgi:hypothetical protein